MANKRKINARRIDRAERDRPSFDFDDMLTARSRHQSASSDERDERAELIWALKSFRWSRN